MSAITEIPANTPRPIGKTETCRPGTESLCSVSPDCAACSAAAVALGPELEEDASLDEADAEAEAAAEVADADAEPDAEEPLAEPELEADAEPEAEDAEAVAEADDLGIFEKPWLR
jgi:hypothetical protein